MICSSNEKIFGKAETATRAIPGASKARKLIKRGLQYNASAKRKYLSGKDSDSSLKPLPKHQFTDTTTESSYVKEDDFEFVLDYRQKLAGKMNWDYVLTIQITFSWRSTLSVIYTCTTDYKCLSQPLILCLFCWINCLRSLFFLPRKLSLGEFDFPLLYTTTWTQLLGPWRDFNHPSRTGYSTLKMVTPELVSSTSSIVHHFIPSSTFLPLCPKVFLVSLLLYWSGTGNSMYFRHYVPLSPF